MRVSVSNSAGPRYKLSSSHTLIKPDLLGFPGIDVFACKLLDRVFKRFTLVGIQARLRNKVISSSCFLCPRHLSKKELIFHFVIVSNHINSMY